MKRFLFQYFGNNEAGFVPPHQLFVINEFRIDEIHSIDPFFLENWSDDIVELAVSVVKSKKDCWLLGFDFFCFEFQKSFPVYHLKMLLEKIEIFFKLSDRAVREKVPGVLHILIRNQMVHQNQILKWQFSRNSTKRKRLCDRIGNAEKFAFKTHYKKNFAKDNHLWQSLFISKLRLFYNLHLVQQPF